ncbi:MAG TPA: outer membrane beta-barrel protein [Cyclobacteriaceae bacterium]|nr:outer membrane beta-barrel protein [Cyclobacteriaceae bacterium]
MERQKFEESFRKSFEDAEVQPSEKVWMNIELDLERGERGRMRKRLTFFKLLAAASVVFGIGLAGTGVYLLSIDQSTTTELAARQDATEPVDSRSDAAERAEPRSSESASASPDSNSASIASSGPSQDAASALPQIQEGQPAQEPGVSSSTDQRGSHDRATAHRTIPSSGEGVASAGDGTTPDRGAFGNAFAQVPDAEQSLTSSERNQAYHAIPTFHDRPLPRLVKEKTIVPHFPKTEPDALDLLLAQIAMEERAEAERRKYDDERIWTSVGFSAGTFSNYGTGPVQSASNMNTMNLMSVNKTLASESRASGVAYSVGVNVGGRIAPRWTLQGGINYMTQNASFMSDAVVTEDYQNFTAAYSAEITKMTDASARVVPTAPYSVNNNMEFLSIPLQAGYLLVNRAFGIQLTGGVATDLFIQNTLQPQSGDLEKVTNGSGSDSPYRTVNFSGLVGTEFSYRFSDKYRISLNPGLRYPFSSMYKSDVGLDATPVTFDVGLRFRYIFD